MAKSKFAEIIETLNDEELKHVFFCLTNEKAYRSMQIVMHTPSHSRAIQIDALTKELNKRNWSWRVEDKDVLDKLK